MATRVAGRHGDRLYASDRAATGGEGGGSGRGER